MPPENNEPNRVDPRRRKAPRRFGLVAVYGALVLTCTILLLWNQRPGQYSLIVCTLHGNGCTCYTVPCEGLDFDSCNKKALGLPPFERQQATVATDAVAAGETAPSSEP